MVKIKEISSDMFYNLATGKILINKNLCTSFSLNISLFPSKYREFVNDKISFWHNSLESHDEPLIISILRVSFLVSRAREV